MKTSELKGKTVPELDEILMGIYREQFNLKMQKATGQLAKSDQIRKNRRDVARIKTVLGERSKQR
jgi:large subunit ribosomal protein L29